MQGLDGRIGEDTYNPVSGKKKSFFSSIRVTAFEWVDWVVGVLQVLCLVIDELKYRWVFIALLGSPRYVQLVEKSPAVEA
jgi:hypothetical protein